MFFNGCKKDEANDTQSTAPTCEITNPTDGQKITKGDTIIISVDAIDNDGNITKVDFYINDIEKNSVSTFPYNIEWNTLNENEGDFKIKAISYDNSGNSNSDEITIEIIKDVSPPIADFSGNPTSGVVSLTVNFSDLSTHNPSIWQWDFGDGANSTNKNPIHTYDNAGIYTVKLTVTNLYGSDTAVKLDYINVSLPPCPSTFTDSRDGHLYSAIQIGTQCWMAENLAYLPSVYPPDSCMYLHSYYYVYDYHGTDVSVAKATSNYQIYGVLYNWLAAMNGDPPSNNVPSGVQGICPDGWHLPSDEEWNILEGAVDSQYGYPNAEWNINGYRGLDCGGNMKETDTIHWLYPNTGATNSSLFTALAGGKRGTNFSFSDMGYDGYFWSSLGQNNWVAYVRDLDYENATVYRGELFASYGFSVRCIKD